MNIKISQIDHNSKYLKDVIALGDANKKTLGLFPKDAYKDSASKKRIIVAVDDTTDKLAGYLLYSISRKKMLVPIVHLCVDSSFRGKKISKLLFDKLKSITKDGYLGVRVHCRVDYLANMVWPKLDFVAVNEIDGRGKKGTRLTVWKYEYDHPNLFSYASQQNEDLSVEVVVDANIFFKLQHPEKPGYDEVAPLLSPWLDIELCITPELYNEISRNQDKVKREEARNFARSFRDIDSRVSENAFQEKQKELRSIFPQTLSTSDVSDLKQLAYAISVGVPFFATRDEAMLNMAEEIFEKFDTQILRPSDVVLMQDELLRGDDYTSSRLAGSRIRLEKVRSQQSEKLVEKFLPDKDETKSVFNQRLQTVLSNAASIDTFVVIGPEGEELGLISHSRQADGQIVVPIFRVGKEQVSQFIAKYLVNSIILIASSEGRDLVKVEEKFLSGKIILALQENGFLLSDDVWHRVVLPEILSKEALISRIENTDRPGQTGKHLSNMVEVLQSETRQPILLEFEKSLWPLKIEEVDIPAFIVPIRPVWAMHLFDVDIAGQDLFGGEPSLILNAENVYYRSSRPKVLSAPGRILWYVSDGDGRYQGSKHLKAVSYLDDVEIGKPKQLFLKYRKLGIYKWEDVFNGVAGGDLDKDVMAFKFSKTEILKHPISLQQLQEIWMSKGQNFNPITALAVDNETFFHLYNIGMKGL